MHASPSPPPLLRLRNVSKGFAGTLALREVSLDFLPGQVLALLGENGAGKSTLLNVVSGALTPDGGTLEWDGVPVHPAGVAAALRRGISHIHQELSGILALTVMENLFLNDYRANRWGMVGRRRMRADARAALARVGGERISPAAPLGSLGIADRQIVEIAKALSGNLRLLAMDEPTSSLTAHEADALLRIIRDLRAAGVSVVFVGHRLEEALAVADRVATLRDGKLVSDRPVAETSRERLINDMTGRVFSMAERYPVQPPANAPVALAAKALRGAGGYGPFSFEVREGEVLGVFGLVSAGRTELLETLCGARRIVGGSLTVFDGGGPPASLGESWRRGIGLLPEDRKRQGIFPTLPIRENVALTTRNARRRLLAGTRDERRTVRRLAERLQVRSAGLDQPIVYLSGGNQQKAILARCLAAGPRLLLLDEPTHGVDVMTKAELYRMLDEESRRGLATVLVSSELPEVLALSSTVLVLAKGRQTFLGRNDGLTESTLLEAAFRFESADAGLPTVNSPANR